MDDPRPCILFIRSGFMAPLRRDTLPSSESFSARNSKGGIMLGSRNPGFQSFLYKSTKSVIQIRRLTEKDLPNVEPAMNVLRLSTVEPPQASNF